MRRAKWLASMLLAGGMAAAGTAVASAQEWDHVDRDYARIEHMRNDIAHDRARLDEDIRCGRQDAAARDAADLARDQRRLQAQRADVHRDIAGDDDEGYYGGGYYNRAYYGNRYGSYGNGAYGNGYGAYGNGYYGGGYYRGNWR